MKSNFEEMGGTYSDINGYLLPNLAIPESPPLGKWGRMRRRYLKEHRPALYSSMLLTGRLDQHLAEIDRSCEEQLELITRQMAKQEGVTEALKATDQMEWVRRMNSIRNRAEEIVLAGLMTEGQHGKFLSRTILSPEQEDTLLRG